MPRIDAHVHVFAKESEEFPRETSDWLPPEREEPIEKLLGEMESSDIDQAVLVQIGGSQYEQHAYLLHCLREHPNRLLGIGLIPGESKSPVDHMDRLADGTGIIGFRLSSIGGPRDPFLKFDIREFETYPIWKHSAEKNYVLWLYVCARDTWQIPYMLEAFPQVRVVLNHLGVGPGKGKFSIDDKGRHHIETSDYRVEPHTVYRFLSYENVMVHVSGQYAISSEPFPYKDIAGWHSQLFNIYGPQRMMWATDFPWIVEDPGYGALANIVNELMPDIGEKAHEDIMGGTAARILNFPKLDS